MEAIVGRDGLGPDERALLAFADRFESELIHQGSARRTFADTLAVGWRLLATLPASSLTRVRPEWIAKYRPEEEADGTPAGDPQRADR